MKAIAKLLKGKSMASLGFAFMLVISLFSPVLPLQSDHVVSAEEGNIVLGYYTSWNPPKNLDPNKLTHINYAFADVCWKGLMEILIMKKYLRENQRHGLVAICKVS